MTRASPSPRGACARHARRAAAGSLAALLGGAACFIEIGEPPGFRFRCEAQADCATDERCLQGRCERPCLSEADCGTGYAGCVNGVCTSACQLSDNVCAAPASCVPILPERDLGLCVVPCRADDEATCPSETTCVDGTCVATCELDDPSCPPGLACVPPGLCVPQTGGGAP